MISTRRIAAALASSRGLFLTAVLAGSLCSLGFLGIGGSSSHTLTARFTDANGLVVGNEVRVAGVAAGSVTSVQLGTDAAGAQFAEVSMDIDADFWPLHQGTAVAVKPKGVLSNVFVEVDPGSMHNPSLGDRPFFDTGHTQSPVNLDEFTNVFTPSVRDAIRTQLQEGVIAFGGAGVPDLNQTLSNANPLTLDAIPLTDVLATRSPQLDNLNFEFDTVSGELAREDANLRPLIVNLNTTLNALAVREADLQGTLLHAANVFGNLDQALSSPTTQADLARIFQQGPEALACATAISTYITPLVTAVNPYISYTAPYSLDTLLADFVTATGFNTLTAKGTLPASGDTLRVEPILADPANTFHDAGGLSQEHAGYTNAQLNGKSVYAEQPPLTGHPTMNGCAPPAGLP
jgi:phospholipid/cholesterol/gamma-HCH transport system substrate-binding protein